MRKHILWIFAFLLLAYAGDRLIGLFLKKLTERSQFRYSRLYFSHEDADILFVGNSRGLTFYQPEVEALTGKKTMNLSYNGMPADLAKCLVMDYLEHHSPPKTMIVDITMCDRENEMLKSSMNPYTPYSQRLTDLIYNTISTKLKSETSLEKDTLDINAGKKVIYGGQFSQLYRYNSELFQRILFHRNKSDKDQLIDRTIGESAFTDTSIKSYEVRMFPNMAQELKEMVEYAQSKGVAVKLVINPYFPAFAETIRDSFLTPLTLHVEKETKLKVYDFSTVLTAREEIGDYQHANKKGSIRYMQILMAQGFFTSNMAIGKTLLQQNDKKPSVLASNYTPSVSDQNNMSFKDLNEAKAVLEDLKKEKNTKNSLKLKKQQTEDWIAVDTMFSK
jgi:hypothetical protein